MLAATLAAARLWLLHLLLNCILILHDYFLALYCRESSTCTMSMMVQYSHTLYAARCHVDTPKMLTVPGQNNKNT
jgi:hypothetical protein